MILSFDINIITLPEHKLSVIIREAGKLTALDSFHKFNTGDGWFKLSSQINKSKVDIIMTLKTIEGEDVLDYKFEDVSTESNIHHFHIRGDEYSKKKIIMINASPLSNPIKHSFNQQFKHLPPLSQTS